MKIKEFIEHKRIREALDESRPINFVEYDPDIIGAITGQAEPAAKLLQIRERLGLSQTEIVERLGFKQTTHLFPCTNITSDSRRLTFCSLMPASREFRLNRS